MIQDKRPHGHGKFVLQPASRASDSARIFRHLKVIENQSCVANQLAHFLCHAVGAFGFDETDSKAAQPGDVYGAMSCPNTAAVFVVVPINHVVATVFDAPMFAVGLKDFFDISLFRLATGQSVNDFVTTFTRFFC